jgi:hypothetical protein
MDRGDIDDPPPALAIHAGQRGADGVEGLRQVDGDNRVPALDGERLDRRGMLDAGIVDENIAAAQFRLCGADQPRAFLAVAHVGGIVGGAHAEFAGDPGADRRDLVRVAEAVYHDVRALRRQRPRHGQPDPAGGTRHHRSLSLQHDPLSLETAPRNTANG